MSSDCLFSSFSRRRKLCTIAMTQSFALSSRHLQACVSQVPQFIKLMLPQWTFFLQEVNSCNKNPIVFSSQNDQKLIPAQGELKYPAGNLDGYIILRVVRRNREKFESSLRLSIHKLDWGMYYTHVTKFLLIIARKIEISHGKRSLNLRISCWHQCTCVLVEVCTVLLIPIFSFSCQMLLFKSFFLVNFSMIVLLQWMSDHLTSIKKQNLHW